MKTKEHCSEVIWEHSIVHHSDCGDPYLECRALGLSGEDVSVIIHSDQTMGRYCLLRHFIPPWHRSLVTSHDGSDIILSVVEGSLRVEVGALIRTLSVGSFVAIPRATPFSWRNAGAEDAVVVATYLSSSLEQLLRAAQSCSNMDDLKYVAATFGVRVEEDLFVDVRA